MILKVSEFIEHVQEDMAGLVDFLVERTGRSTPSERDSWNKSLPELSKILSKASEKEKSIKSTHLYLGHLSLEYRLPSASAWCDAVLIGDNKKGIPGVFIIELKDWDTTGDLPGFSEGLITHQGNQWHHPSDQLKGYVTYCQRFHSSVAEYSAEVSGGVFFTRKTDYSAYLKVPNDSLVREYPIFNLDNAELLAERISETVSLPNEKFAIDFEKGYYRQNRNILVQVAQKLKESSLEKRTPFELLDEQRKGFSLVMGLLEQINNQEHKKKHVIIVEGPPGSGKSALATNLWMEAVLKFVQPELGIKKAKKEKKANISETDNIVFVTTSSSQKSNWQATFTALAKEYSGKAFILPVNQFGPGITSNMVSKLREKTGEGLLVKDWQENVDLYLSQGGKLKSLDNHHFISIVDEAHALINTEGHNIGFSSGWVLQAGPQAFHVVRSSQISVFFTDGKQSYRDSETTTVANLEDFASRLDAEVHKISLAGHQFRCGGSKEYVEFIEKLFDNGFDGEHDLSWRKSSFNKKGVFDFEFVDHPHQLDEKLRIHLNRGLTARLISSYSREWKTKRNPNPHRVAPKNQDFFFEYELKGEKKVYARPWNFAPGEDYSLFIQGIPGSAMFEDPLCEIGCPYVVRGFDYDYLGILWLEDLVFRNGNWVVQTDFVKETAISSTSSKARKAREVRLKAGEQLLTNEELLLLDKIIKGYRILLTRALKGIYVYVADLETREYLKTLFGR